MAHPQDTNRGYLVKQRIDITGPEDGYNGQVFKTKQGYVKHHYRPATAGYCVEVKSEPSGVSGNFWGIISTVDAIPSTAESALGASAIAGVCRIKSGYTMTGGSLSGSYAQVSIQGTVNGSGCMLAAQYALIEASSGTLTSVSHMAVSWLDSHLAAAPSSGTLSFQYITNNAAATFDNVFYIYAGNKITNLLTIESTTDTGLVGDNVASDFTFQNYRTIKCNLGGESYYLIADKLA